MLHSLAEWNPDSVLRYKWGYALSDILDLFKVKMTQYAELRRQDYEFLVELAKAALGGGTKEGEYALDSGEGLEDLSDEQAALLREALGDDYDRVIAE